jgi:hypothetical protein
MTGAEALRDRLADIEAEQAALEAELAVFEADYTRRVVTVLAQLHEAEARLLTLVADRSGEPADADAAETAQGRARRTTGAAGAVPAPPKPVPPPELKRLFRDAAKQMHPDVAASADARMHAEAFMKRLNHAYRAGDAEAMLDLVRQWGASPFANASPEPDAVAARAETGLQAAVAAARQRLEEVRASELAELMERAMAAAAEGRDFLAEVRAGAEEALAAARARLAALDGAG